MFHLLACLALTPCFQEPAPEEPTAAAVAAAEDPWQDPSERFLPIRFGLLLDLFLAFTEKDDSDDAFNELRIRSARLHASAPVDEGTLAFVTLDLGDEGDGAEFTLREAALRIDRLALPGWPERFHLLIGQYYVDLGAWNTVLPGEFAAPQLDGFRRIYLGGNLAARGIAAHHLIPSRDLRLRWSLGFASELEGHDPDARDFGAPPPDGPDASGRAGFHNWAVTGRAEAVRFFADDRSARAGASVLYSPAELRTTALPGGAAIRDEERHFLGGLDFGYRRQFGPERAHQLTLELWLDDDHYRSVAPSVLRSERERGEALLYTYQHDAAWSLGGLWSRFDQPGPEAAADGHYHAIWSGHRLSDRNRVAIFLTHTNPGPGAQKWYTVGAQWTIELGARRAESRRDWN